MKRIAIFPGSFNPLHDGHYDVISKVWMLFDELIVLQCVNPDKPSQELVVSDVVSQHLDFLYGEKVKIDTHEGLLIDYINKITDQNNQCVAVIKGLRNSIDFEYEKNQQYWNEDLDLVQTVLYVISDRNLTHFSSSAVRQLNKIREN